MITKSRSSKKRLIRKLKRSGKIVLSMTMSLDGFVNDRNGEVQKLYPNLAALRKTSVLREAMQTTGAVLMGGGYDMADGDFTDYEFQVPIFVLTHDAPRKIAKGENEKLRFTFVTDGLASAVKQAKAVAGNKNVRVIGGASITQQMIKAGLFDELQIGIAPVLLGNGLRLFEHLSGEFELNKIREGAPLGTATLIFFAAKQLSPVNS